MNDERQESAPKPLEPSVADHVNVGEAVIMTGTRSWQQQYARMKRAYLRATTASTVNVQTEDDYYSFFVWCFHLKDWLQNDRTVAATIGTAAETLVNNIEPLKFCADLANGIKHLRADRKTRIDPDSKLSVLHADFQPDAFQNDAFQTDERIVIVAAGRYWNAREVADVCVAAWDDFLRTHGLM